jgi:diguanylate cyclase (GGDEF)-like protein
MTERTNRRKAITQRMRLGLAAAGLAVVLGAMAVGIALTHAESKSRILTNFEARGATSAEFISTYLSQQGKREAQSAQRFLAGHNQSLPLEFQRTVTEFGSSAAVLLDRNGRLLQVVPSDPAILGTKIAPRYPHLIGAEAGRVTVSGVVRSAAQAKPVVAVAVPYPTPDGRRVFSVAYPVAGSVLATFVEHTVASKRHLVILVDASGKIITASPHMSAATLSDAAPRLGNVVAHASHGGVMIAGTPSTFVVAPVAGTPWHLVTALPNDHLFASVSGWASWLPWIVFAVIALLGLIALLLLSRSLSAHTLLESLTTELAHAARTDPVTGLANRRSLDERVAQASAYANRYDEPLSALLIDLDHFKQINDNYGHDMGDEVLRAVSECMRTIFRDSDIFGRWGGDEFLAVLPGPHPDATRAGERLCAEVRALDMSRFGLSESITVSVGCSSATSVSPQELIIESDNALYRAKAAGRDRVAALT